MQINNVHSITIQKREKNKDVIGFVRLSTDFFVDSEVRILELNKLIENAKSRNDIIYVFTDSGMFFENENGEVIVKSKEQWSNENGEVFAKGALKIVATLNKEKEAMDFNVSVV